MKSIIILAALAAGCATSPCVGTARSAAALARYCLGTGDPKLTTTCHAAYESVRKELAEGICSSEVTR